MPHIIYVGKRNRTHVPSRLPSLGGTKSSQQPEKGSVRFEKPAIWSLSSIFMMARERVDKQSNGSNLG
jgi:hypothetical protein